MNKKTWWVSVFWILFTLILCMDLIAAITYFIARLYLYFAQNIPLGIDFPVLLRIIKGASFGGIIIGIGCLYVSFNKSR
ncbi:MULTISPECIES: hypothetical protein [Enterobacter]|jgi:hypothetical protein|uniref:hypothetical protein n=1 Tax=Enterobacter TaxID=547 RepID=UPI001356DB2C|nr:MULTISPECIES: hypothetical protein [Enterobacter]MBW4210154.1 hypothetical protein [Enterobacter asburiae]